MNSTIAKRIYKTLQKNAKPYYRKMKHPLQKNELKRGEKGCIIQNSYMKAAICPNDITTNWTAKPHKRITSGWKWAVKRKTKILYCRLYKECCTKQWKRHWMRYSKNYALISDKTCSTSVSRPEPPQTDFWLTKEKTPPRRLSWLTEPQRAPPPAAKRKRKRKSKNKSLYIYLYIYIFL